MRLTLRHRAVAAAIGTLVAMVLTSIGHSPVAGPADPWAWSLWALGIGAGVTAFVAAASVCSDIARRRDQAPLDVHSHQGAGHLG